MIEKLRTFLIFFLFSLLSYSKGPQPLLEMGAGIFHANFPYYPGSKEDRTIVLPFPAFIIRGKYLRAKRDEGVRGRFLNQEFVELDLSADGTLPSDGDNAPAREGMPQLDLVLEFGPRAIFHLLKSKKAKVDLHLGLRYIFNFEIFRFEDRGLALNPYFSFKFPDLISQDDYLVLTIGSKWTTRELQKYYYEVDPKFETNNRPSYHAKSGLFETSMSLFYASRVYKNLWGFGGVAAANYALSANKDSPLLTRKLTLSTVVGLYWMFYQSEAREESI